MPLSSRPHRKRAMWHLFQLRVRPRRSISSICGGRDPRVKPYAVPTHFCSLGSWLVESLFADNTVHDSALHTLLRHNIASFIFFLSHCGPVALSSVPLIPFLE